MRISVTAKTRAKKELVKETGAGQYTVAVAEAPEDRRANQALSRALAEYFDVAPSRVRLASGHTAKRKIFEIN